MEIEMIRKMGLGLAGFAGVAVCAGCTPAGYFFITGGIVNTLLLGGGLAGLLAGGQILGNMDLGVLANLFK
jgi:hypothetical protein